MYKYVIEMGSYKNNLQTTMAFATHSQSFFRMTEADLKGYPKNVVKYILRFQEFGMPNNPNDNASSLACINLIEEYYDLWEYAQEEAYEIIDTMSNVLEVSRGDERNRMKNDIKKQKEFIKYADEAKEALDLTLEYFIRIDETIKKM